MATGAILAAAILTSTTAFLIAMAAPALSLTLGNSLLRQFDSSHEIRAGAAAAAQALGPGALGPVQVLVTFPTADASSPLHRQTLSAISHEMARAPDIASVSAPVFADDNGSALLNAVLSVDPEDLRARQTVDWMRTHLPEAAGAGSARVDVGGPTALIKDFDDRVAKTEPLVLALTFGLSMDYEIFLLTRIRERFL